jgi:hypothetical protein
MMKKYDIVDDRKERREQKKNNGSSDAKYGGKPGRDSLSVIQAQRKELRCGF